MTITKRQLDVLEYIHEHKQKNDWAPTVREIGAALDIWSTSTVFDHLARLKAKGLITTLEGSPRAISITEKGMEDLK